MHEPDRTELDSGAGAVYGLGGVYEYIDIYLSRQEHRRVSNVPDLAEGKELGTRRGVKGANTVSAEAGQADAEL